MCRGITKMLLLSKQQSHNKIMCMAWPCTDLGGKEVILHPCLPRKPLVQRHLHKACAKHRHSLKCMLNLGSNVNHLHPCKLAR